MRKVTMWLLIVSLPLMIVFAAGCIFFAPYEKMEAPIPAGDVLQIQFQVGEDEVLRGNWTADENIEGSYLRPDGRKLTWSSTSMQHDFYAT